MNEFVYGNQDRIFVNTDMGCEAKCSYCYLPHLNIVHGMNRINAEDAIKRVEKLEYYKKGENGTIISIGCGYNIYKYHNKKKRMTIRIT